jgi:ubiquinol-cytochrome c reductase cytochrome c1 subunit
MMFKKLLLFFSLLLISNISVSDLHASTKAEVKKLKWTFNGVLGYYDRAALKRGFQVYNEVCSSCHSMNLVAYRKLKDIGFSDSEIKTIAAAKTVKDGPNDEGEMFERPGKPSDRFVAPYPNKQAAVAANGAYPPDMSLIVKASEHSGGPNYIYSVLTGYEDAPKDFPIPEGKYYNRYFEGHVISMAPPLSSDDLVTYADGTNATMDQMAKDVSNFLQWASEPELEERKKMGFSFMVFLGFATVVSYLIKRRVWRDIK